MSILHFINVIIDGDQVSFSRCFRLESQKSEKSLFVFRIRGHTFLNEELEVVEPLLILFRVTLSFIIDKFEATSSKDIAKLADESRVLVVFSRYIERKVFTINNTLHKSEVMGQ